MSELLRSAGPALVAAVVLVVGCADDGAPVEADERPAGRYALVDLQGLTAAGAEVDPFAERRPETIECEEAATGWELYEGADSYFVETWRCDYHAAMGPLTTAIRAGDVGIVRLFHFPLVGPEGAEAHLGLAVDGEVVWEKTLAIPQAGGFVTERWRAGRDVPVGAPVVLQVDNHGDNSYQFLELGLIVGQEE